MNRYFNFGNDPNEPFETDKPVDDIIEPVDDIIEIEENGNYDVDSSSRYNTAKRKKFDKLKEKTYGAQYSEENLFRMSSEDMTKYTVYTSIDQFLMRPEKHIGKEKAAYIRHLFSEEISVGSVDSRVDPWCPHATFKAWTYFGPGRSGDHIIYISDFDFFPKSDFPMFTWRLKQMKGANGGIIFVPARDKYMDPDILSRTYMDSDQTEEYYDDESNLSRPGDEYVKNETPSKMKVRVNTGQSEDSDSDDSDDSDSSDSDSESTRKDDILRYPLNRPRSDPTVRAYLKAKGLQQKNMLIKDRVMRHMIGRYLDNLFGKLTTQSKYGKKYVCIDDDSAILANIITLYTQNSAFWIKIMDSGVLLVRLQLPTKSAPNQNVFAQEYFTTSVQYDAMKTLRTSATGHNFRVWQTANWFSLEQVVLNTDTFIRNHFILHTDKYSNEERFKNLRSWYAKIARESIDADALTGKLTPQEILNKLKLIIKPRDDATAHRLNQLISKYSKIVDESVNNTDSDKSDAAIIDKVNLFRGKHSAYHFLTENLFLNTRALDWSMLKISRDGFMVFVYEKLANGSYILLRLTALENVKHNKRIVIDTTKSDTLDSEDSEDSDEEDDGRIPIIIDYFENTKDKTDTPSRKPTDFIQNLSDSFNKIGVDLWVNIIADTSDAAGFWESMKTKRYVKLSDQAEETILDVKKEAISEYVSEYFLSILGKDTLGKLRREWKTAIPQALKKEIQETQLVNGRFIGNGIEVSCQLPYESNGNVTIYRHPLLPLKK